MKKYLSAAMVILTLSLGSPCIAQAQADDSTPASSQTQQASDRQSQYGQLKQIYLADRKELWHILMSGPATRETIELKAAMHSLHQLEEDYNDAKLSGADAETLAGYGRQYVELIMTVFAKHKNLYVAVAEPLQAYNSAVDQLQEHYGDLLQADTEMQDNLKETEDEAQPVVLGSDRVQELGAEVSQAIAAKKAADPNLVFTDDMIQQELQSAAVRILDRRTTRAHDQF